MPSVPENVEPKRLSLSPALRSSVLRRPLEGRLTALAPSPSFLPSIGEADGAGEETGVGVSLDWKLAESFIEPAFSLIEPDSVERPKSLRRLLFASANEICSP